MTSTVIPFPLELRPTRRPEALDLRIPLRTALDGGPLDGATRLLCLSHHTTAGFLDPTLQRRLGSDPERVQAFLDALGSVFPPDAGYDHDRLHLRNELTEAQKATEPLNADAHLAFIGGGFSNCTSVEATDRRPLWFVDLDGVYEDRQGQAVQRTRRATVIGYQHEETVARLRLDIPVPNDLGVIRLDAPEVGLMERIQEVLDREGVTEGRVKIRLADPAPGVGITVNEFEALLMERDLTRVLADPLGFTRSGSLALGRALSALGVEGARRERLLGRALAHPIGRVLRISRSISLGVLGTTPSGRGSLLLGTYQSPLLVQRCGPAGGRRTLDLRVRRLR